MYYKTSKEVMNFAGLRIANISATTAYMIVDLSDITNWKHLYTGHLDLSFLSIMISPNATFVGNVCVGFLGNVGDTKGDLACIKTYSFDSGNASGTAIIDNVGFDGIDSFIHCGEQRSYLPYYENNAAFQTDVKLVGPGGGAASHFSGNGDLALLINRSAGNISLGLLVGYTSHK